jgi:large subunit ribosomal protein L15
MVMKIKKKKKARRLHGQNTYGRGSRKKGKGSGHRGGFGMAGTGKKADHKKSLILKKYGNKYFGKQGITSKRTKRNKLKIINLGDIQRNIDSLKKKFGKNNELNLKDYKILGTGDLKGKLKIIARAFTESAKKKIEKAGGEAVLAVKSTTSNLKNDKEKPIEKTEINKDIKEPNKEKTKEIKK